MLDDIRALLNARGVRVDIVAGIISELSGMESRHQEFFYHMCLGRNQTEAAILCGLPRGSASWVVNTLFENIRDLLVISGVQGYYINSRGVV